MWIGKYASPVAVIRDLYFANWSTTTLHVCMACSSDKLVVRSACGGATSSSWNCYHQDWRDLPPTSMPMRSITNWSPLVDHLVLKVDRALLQWTVRTTIQVAWFQRYLYSSQEVLISGGYTSPKNSASREATRSDTEKDQAVLPVF